jgi:hypothetical protein
MGPNAQLSDKEIIVEQQKTIKVLQAENIRLTVELRKQNIAMPSHKVELIKSKI